MKAKEKRTATDTASAPLTPTIAAAGRTPSSPAGRHTPVVAHAPRADTNRGRTATAHATAARDARARADNVNGQGGINRRSGRPGRHARLYFY